MSGGQQGRERELTVVFRFGLLTHCYDNFSKAQFAALTRKIAEAAAGGDGLCRWLFREAGRVLGRLVVIQQACDVHAGY